MEVRNDSKTAAKHPGLGDYLGRCDYRGVCAGGGDMKPHVHAELIKAWADGAEIQSHIPGNGWITNPSPLWREDTEYRIKPEEKKPVVRWLWAWHNLQLWKITDFYTEDELTQQGYDVSGMICLEFTRTEFPK